MRACPGEGHWEQLAVYFVYRYFLKGACEGDALSRGGAAVFSVLIIEVMGIYHWLSEGSFQIEDQIENAKNYSKEVEYCIENMEALYDRFWEDEAFSMEALALAVKNPALKKCEKSLEFVTHTFEPVFDQYSRVLVLGSMPSPKSREQGFYYGHPRNRFWPVLAKILGEKEPVTIEEKRQMALKNHIAVWDVLESCEIHGADDGSIKNPVANDMNRVLKQAPIQAVFTTGTKAGALYKRFCQEKTGLKAISLPSTSPANCRMGMEELEVEYRKILAFLAEK